MLRIWIDVGDVGYLEISRCAKFPTSIQQPIDAIGILNDCRLESITKVRTVSSRILLYLSGRLATPAEPQSHRFRYLLKLSTNLANMADLTLILPRPMFFG